MAHGLQLGRSLLSTEPNSHSELHLARDAPVQLAPRYLSVVLFLSNWKESHWGRRDATHAIGSLMNASDSDRLAIGLARPIVPMDRKNTLIKRIGRQIESEFRSEDNKLASSPVTDDGPLVYSPPPLVCKYN